MKGTKKLASLLLALVMVLSLTATVFAANINAPVDATHTYAVYQIFTGDLSADGKTLSNVKWGQNGTGTVGEPVDSATLAALAAATNATSDAEKLAVIEKYVDLETEAIGTVANGKSLQNVDTGYYLIKDLGVDDGSGNYYLPDGENFSLYIVQLVGDLTIAPKRSIVTSDKKVDDKNDSNATENDINWQDSADYDIGDDVPFKLSAKIAEDYGNYTNGYKLTFHDRQSAGLTFNNDVVVKVGNTVIDPDNYTVVTDGLEDDCTFEVHFPNLKAISSVKAGSVITVEYTSRLNENAVIGSEGNPNTSHVTYTNNPNDEQGAENGKTPDDTVIVFTFETIVNKVDKDGQPLNGAGFTLYKYDADAIGDDKWVQVGDAITDVTTFEFKGLDDGRYKLVESTTPNGYNTIDPIYFVIEATHDTDSAQPELKTLTAVITDENGNKKTEIKDGANVNVDFGTVDVTNGSVTTDVVNQSGTQLPSTGGMGTTIFYVLGSVLALAAAVLLVTKKRMSVRG